MTSRRKVAFSGRGVGPSDSKKRLLNWAQRQRCSPVSVKFILMRLAAYADGNGIVSISVGRLAEEMGTSDRTVQRCLRALEESGLIAPTGKKYFRNVPYYRLGPQSLDGTMTSVSPLNGDTDVTVCDAKGDTAATSTGDSHVIQNNGKPMESSPCGPLSPQAGLAFTALLREWPQDARDNTNERAALARFFEAATQLGDPWRVVKAGRDYLTRQRGRHRDFPLPGLNRWLADKDWKLVASHPVEDSRFTEPPPFPLSGLRAEVVNQLGEGWAKSWLDPCRLAADRAHLHPRNGFAAKRIAAEIGGLLARHEIGIGAPLNDQREK